MTKPPSPFAPGVLCLATLAGCSTIHGVRPVGDGNFAIEGSFGGPIVELFGAPVPLPLSSVGAAYGLDDATDVHLALHPSGLAFFGVVGADVGVSRQVFPQKGGRPRLMADLTVLTFFGPLGADADDAGGARVFLQPTLTTAWDWGRDDRHTAYAAITDLIQPFPNLRAPGALALGHHWGLSPTFGLVTELKWISPWQSTEALAPMWYAPGDLGAISFQLGFNARFGASE